MAPSAIVSPREGEQQKKGNTITSSHITNKLETLNTSPTSPSESLSPISSSFTNDHKNTNPLNTPLTPPLPNLDASVDVHDLVCIGFGPASLAIAIALHDTHSLSSTHPSPKCLYLEKQPSFAWHAGMQLPSAKMQISFLKDLATPRQPTSKFTFMNYLWTKERLDSFINLGTFLPSRREYEDYLRWCARWFEKKGEVRYDIDVTSVVPGKREDGKVVSWDVIGTHHGEVVRWKARHVVIAAGGKAVIPQNLRGVKNVFHSSEYAYRISQIEAEATKSREQRTRRLRFAVIGGGQSAAEIFNDLWDRFYDAEVKLIIKGSSLRPSDDSPFVNEIFNPSHVSTTFSFPPSLRASSISLDRATNYGVVRLELLENLYERFYHQRLSNSNELDWRCRILPNRVVARATATENGMRLNLDQPEEYKVLAGNFKGESGQSEEDEEIEVDYLFTATGYLRNTHESILSSTKDLLPTANPPKPLFPVARNYSVQYDPSKVDFSQTGVWLQGCNEATHGLSDTLLSILAVRGGELVESIFGTADGDGRRKGDGDYIT